LYLRPGIDGRKLLGLILLATGAGILYLALPGWVWFLALGGGLIAAGWVILRPGKKL